MPEITMPRLSDTMEDGVVSAWLKQVGDQITRGEVVAEIETDKALMELEAYEDGVLEQILAQPGTRIPIGEPIAIVGDGSGTSAAAVESGASVAAAGMSGASVAAAEMSGASVAEAGTSGASAAASGTAASVVAQAGPSSSDAAADAAAQTASPAAVSETGALGVQPDSTGTDAPQGERKKSSPLARKIARELGVDLAAVVGTGPGGRITRQDVETAHHNGASATASPASDAPATAAPATAAPATAAPATAAPATAAPGTAAPGTVTLATSAPAPSATVASAPGAAALGTATPATAAPVTAALATSVPVTSAPAAAAPVSSAPATIGSASVANVTAAQRIPVSGDYEEIPLTNIQRVSAARLTESKQQAPHIYLTSAIDVTDLLAFRAQINETLAAAGAGKVSVNDLLVKAVATTLRKEPSVNVSFAGDKLLRHKGIHLGIAVATPAGLLVPVIRDADRKSVSEIAADSRDKATRARDRKLRAEEMSGGTFTISNLGMFGIEHFTAVINPPESAILAVGAATDELRLVNGDIITRKILRVTLSADHRAIDGAVAAQFLAHLKDLLEHPLRIVT